MYDVVIIGSGCAGLGAAIYASRFQLKTLVLGDMQGGTITLTHSVENYPGFIKLSGLELADGLIKHAKTLGAEIKTATVSKIEKTETGFRIIADKNSLETKAVIIATGTEHRKLNIPGEKEFANRGVSYCATCDAAFFKGKQVVIVGGGDSAVKESLILAEHAAEVTILHRGQKLNAEPVNLQRMQAKSNIKSICCNELTEIYGDNIVKGVKLQDGRDIPCAGVFIEAGRLPRSELAKDLGVKLNQKDEIEINRFAQTNIPGVFAAGDVTDADWKQAITGVAEGAHAANQAFEYIARFKV